MTILERLSDIWNAPVYISELENEVIKLKTRLKELETDIVTIGKLADMYTSRELAVSEERLFRAELQKETETSVEELDETIGQLTSIRLSLEASPAIGGRMVRNKNTQLADINTRLAAAISARGKLNND